MRIMSHSPVTDDMELPELLFLSGKGEPDYLPPDAMLAALETSDSLRLVHPQLSVPETQWPETMRYECSEEPERMPTFSSHIERPAVCRLLCVVASVIAWGVLLGWWIG